MQFSARGGTYNYTSSGAGTPILPSTNQILLEDDDDLLLENDEQILLEA